MTMRTGFTGNACANAAAGSSATTVAATARANGIPGNTGIGLVLLEFRILSQNDTGVARRLSVRLIVEFAGRLTRCCGRRRGNPITGSENGCGGTIAVARGSIDVARKSMGRPFAVRAVSVMRDDGNVRPDFPRKKHHAPAC